MNTQETVSSHPSRNAAFFRRMSANAYDAILLFALWILASTPIAIVFTIRHPGLANPMLDILLQALLPAVGFAYYGYKWTKSGQTLGMQAWRLTLVGTHGRLSLAHAFWRYLVALTGLVALIGGFMLIAAGHYLAAVLPLLFFASDYLWIFFDPDAQTLHDRLSGTRVLFVPKSTHARKQPDAH